MLERIGRATLAQRRFLLSLAGSALFCAAMLWLPQPAHADIADTVNSWLCGMLRDFCNWIFGAQVDVLMSIGAEGVLSASFETMLGGSGTVGEMSSGVTTTVFNLLLLRLAGNVAVAAYGVVANYALVATAIFNGVAQGAQPLVSRCYGKNDAAGARKLLLLGSGTALALAAALYAVLFGFTGPIVAVFNSENSALMAQYAFSGVRIYFLGYFFAGFNIVAAGYLGAVDRPAEASATSLSRGIVAIVACSLVLSALFGMNGVWAAFPASEAITACLTLFLLKRKN